MHFTEEPRWRSVQAVEAGQSRSGPLLRRPVRTQAVVSALDEALHGGVACGSLTEVKKTLSKPSNIDLEPSEPGEKI